jgi:hypothetical protein
MRKCTLHRLASVLNQRLELVARPTPNTTVIGR